MKHCPTCKGPLIRQPLFHSSLMMCYHCYSMGVYQGFFQTLLQSSNYQGLKKTIQSVPSLQIPSCIDCSKTMQLIPITPTHTHQENLRVFKNWKYYFYYHKKGLLQIYQCKNCTFYWMNVRTWCQFKIDWDRLEIQQKEAQIVQAASRSGFSFDDPYQFVLGLVFGIPQLENVPNVSDLPLITYFISFVVGFFTSKGLKDIDFLKEMTFNPDLSLSDNGFHLVSYAFVHESGLQFLGVIIFFLVFAPIVEHELSIINYLFLLVGSAISSVILYGFFLHQPLIGFGGIVAGVLAFFCFRFPSSIIGFGVVRFTAPIALLFFLVYNFQSNLGGLLFGTIFHLISPLGKSTEAFKRLGILRLQKEKNIKNWKKH